MISTSIILKEISGTAHTNSPVRLGIPFPKGMFTNPEELSLTDSNNKLIPFCISQTTYWPDKTCKWGLIDFQASVEPNETKSFTLCSSPNSHTNETEKLTASLKISHSENQINIDTGKAQFSLDKHILAPFKDISVNGEKVSEHQSEIELIDSNGTLYRPAINSISEDSTNNALRSTLIIKGCFESDTKNTIANFETKLSFYAGKSEVSWDFTIHNPKAAEHPGGIWDLGDPGSIFFKSLAINFNLSNDTTASWKSDHNQSWQTRDSCDFLIYQESSGGDNWNGNTHKNHENKIPHQHKGYFIQENGNNVEAGDRVSPFINTGSITTYIKNFWQNFPKAFEIKNNKLCLQLFPSHYPDNFELQGGEKKTHTLFLSFGKERDHLHAITHPLSAELTSDWYKQAKALPYIPTNHTKNDLDKLINEGLDGQNNYFKKREVVDEYGWRNFGDIYADHETLGYQGEQALVSHYNNQYDSLYGFARQYMLTGDRRWFDLMDQLAIHVTDIDIYNTQADRAEYNGGLFWHTDHYLDAFTSSHRTYSKFHHSEDELGGGPGTEHCYTGGLLYHYLLTGSDASKQAVLTLRNWIENLHEGNGTILERVLAIKNVDIPALRAALSGNQTHIYKYPLTRGTGNYLSTVIDSFVLTCERRHIDLAEHIIEQTIHPLEDISERHLENIEVTWSYTIFLQALVKYLSLKESLEEYDSAFFYARDSLLNFANWMVEHEYPFLDKPDILEYPNHTWVAQEIRKANLFFSAHQYSTDKEKRSHYLSKAQYFYNYLIRELEHEETRSFSRILAILMQNHGPHTMLFSEQQLKSFDMSKMKPYSKPKKPTASSILKTIFIDLLKGVARLSLSKEIEWLQNRSAFFARLSKPKK